MLKEKDKNLSIRIYQYCIHYMRSCGFTISYPAKDTIGEYLYTINNVLMGFEIVKFRDHSIGTPEQFVEVMLKHAREMVTIPDKELEWLESSERACMYMWIVIRNSFLLQEQNYRPEYETLYLPENPHSHQSRFEAIKHFYDRIEMAPGSKINSIEAAKARWVRLNSEPQYFKKFDRKDDVLCQWAWQYLSEKLKERSDKLGVNYYTTSAGKLSPMSVNDKYLSVYGVLDTWVDSSEFKELLLLKMNKTMAQKRYRSNMDEKKVITTTLRTETRNKLDAIATKRGIRVSEVLEWLICNEYKQQNKNDR